MFTWRWLVEGSQFVPFLFKAFLQVDWPLFQVANNERKSSNQYESWTNQKERDKGTPNSNELLQWFPFTLVWRVATIVALCWLETQA